MWCGGFINLSSSNLGNEYYNESGGYMVYVLKWVTFERHVQHGRCQEREE